jgi:rod shape determining protein RodA
VSELRVTRPAATSSRGGAGAGGGGRAGAGAGAGAGALLLGFDPFLAAAAGALGIFSLVAIHAIAPVYVDRQAAYLALGFALMALISRFDYMRLRELKWVIYGVLIASILFVLAFGSAARGSTRAISLSVFSFQSSELGKVLLIVFLATVVVDASRRVTSRDLALRVMGLALIPAVLVIKEPDLGSGLVYIAIAFAVLYVSGIDWRPIAALAAALLAALTLGLTVLPLAGVHVLTGNEAQRFTAFLDPSAPANRYAAYQQVQAGIAIGAGGLGGRGAAASQTTLGLVPVPYTDDIFAVIAERFGFVGAAFLLLLYALMIWRTLRIVQLAGNLFGALIAAGAFAMLLFQVFVNVGVTMGILPNTGVTLPLVSYGGSSVLTTFLALGLLQAIYAHGRVSSPSKGHVLRF